MKLWIRRIDFYAQLAGFILPIVKFIVLNSLLHLLRYDIRFAIIQFIFNVLPIICCIQLLSILLNLFFFKRQYISRNRLVISIVYILYLPLVFLSYYFEWTFLLNFLISFLYIISGITIFAYLHLTYIEFLKVKKLVMRKYYLESV